MVTVTSVAGVTNFAEFREKYNKVYSNPKERIYRERVFMDNLQDMVIHNQKHSNGLVSWAKQVDKDMDKTADEFMKARTGLLKSNREALDNCDTITTTTQAPTTASVEPTSQEPVTSSTEPITSTTTTVSNTEPVTSSQEPVSSSTTTVSTTTSVETTTQEQ